MSPRNHFSSKYGPYFISDKTSTFHSRPKKPKKSNIFKVIVTKIRKFVLGFGLKN